MVEAFTYNGHREKMRVIGKEELLEPLNRSALKIAKKVAMDTPEGMAPNLMAVNISNSNIWKEDDKKAFLSSSFQIFEFEMFTAIKFGAIPSGVSIATFLAIFNADLFKGSSNSSLPITLIFSL